MRCSEAGGENDVERKIFADNALDCLGRLGKGVLSDGDEKRNESIRDTPCRCAV